MTTIPGRVAKGAQFLDDADPEWWRPDGARAIDLEALNLRNPGNCVLGQRCPLEVLAWWQETDISQLDAYDNWDAYWAYASRLSGMEGARMVAWAAERGFTTSAGDDLNTIEAEFAELTAEWRRVITARRSA